MSVAGDAKHSGRGKKAPPRRQTEAEFRQELSHLWSEYSYGDDGHKIVLKWKGQYEVVAVASRISDDDEPQVIIATGTDLFSALHALNARMGRDEWRKDKPWSPAKK